MTALASVVKALAITGGEMAGDDNGVVLARLAGRNKDQRVSLVNLNSEGTGVSLNELFGAGLRCHTHSLHLLLHLGKGLLVSDVTTQASNTGFDIPEDTQSTAKCATFTARSWPIRCSVMCSCAVTKSNGFR